MDGDPDKTSDRTSRSIKNNNFMSTDGYLMNPINIDSSTFINSTMRISSDTSPDNNLIEKDNALPDSLLYESASGGAAAKVPQSAASGGAAAKVPKSVAAASAEKPAASVPASASSKPEGSSRVHPVSPVTKPETRVLASTDCTEKIVLCIDISSEMNKKRYKTKAGASFSAIELVKKALKLFVYNKMLIGVRNARHQYAIVLLLDQALWLFDFTPSFPDVFTHLEELQALQTPGDVFDMTTLFDVLLEKAKPPAMESGENMIPPYIVRAILIYGRSHCTPVISNFISQNMLMSSPCFFMDIIYLNEPPADSNLAAGIFTELCDLDDRGRSYIFDESKAPTKVFDAFAKLVAHPLQRVPQNEFGFCLEPILIYDESELEQHPGTYAVPVSKGGVL